MDLPCKLWAEYATVIDFHSPTVQSQTFVYSTLCKCQLHPKPSPPGQTLGTRLEGSKNPPPGKSWDAKAPGGANFWFKSPGVRTLEEWLWMKLIPALAYIIAANLVKIFVLHQSVLYFISALVHYIQVIALASSFLVLSRI